MIKFPAKSPISDAFTSNFSCFVCDKHRIVLAFPTHFLSKSNITIHPYMRPQKLPWNSSKKSIFGPRPLLCFPYKMLQDGELCTPKPLTRSILFSFIEAKLFTCWDSFRILSSFLVDFFCRICFLQTKIHQWKIPMETKITESWLVISWYYWQSVIVGSY